MVAAIFAVSRERRRSSRSRSRATTSRSTCQAVEIYRDQGENFQVSTAPGTDGIVRRIEVEADDDHSNGDWAVFALANSSDQQLDRLIVAPHFRLVGSGVFGRTSARSAFPTITPSEGFALDRQPSVDADVFLVTLNPGSVMTFVAELASPKLPQIYLWEPEAYKDTVNSYTLFRGIVIGIAGLLALFLTSCSWSRGRRCCRRRRPSPGRCLPISASISASSNKVVEISPDASRYGGPAPRSALAATSWCSCSPISISTAGTAISATARSCGSPA